MGSTIPAAAYRLAAVELATAAAAKLAGRGEISFWEITDETEDADEDDEDDEDDVDETDDEPTLPLLLGWAPFKR